MFIFETICIVYTIYIYIIAVVDYLKMDKYRIFSVFIATNHANNMFLDN